MSSYRDLEIYQIAQKLCVKIHWLSLKLPKHELYEQGSQIRRSSKSIKDQISEGYGRRRYKADFEKFLIIAQASCDECTGQIETIIEIYPDHEGWSEIYQEYLILGKRINKYFQYVEVNWKSPK